MKAGLKMVLRILAMILGVAFVVLSGWMAIVAKDLIFFFYSALIGALLIRYAILGRMMYAKA